MWRDGLIPDISEAVDSPHILSRDQATARRLLNAVPQLPTRVWAGTRRTPVRCGTRTRSSPGCLCAAGSTQMRHSCLPTGGRLGGTPVWSRPSLTPDRGTTDRSTHHSMQPGYGVAEL